jgi:hypothetical protein
LGFESLDTAYQSDKLNQTDAKSWPVGGESAVKEE